MDNLIFSPPNFISGVAKVMDLGNTFNNFPKFKNPETADCNAIYLDWRAVGNDMRQAMHTINSENPDLKSLPNISRF